MTTFHTISIDPDFKLILDETSESNTFYLSYYATDESEPSHYYKITQNSQKLRYLNDDDKQQETNDITNLISTSPNHYELTIKNQIFKLWYPQYHLQINQQISSVAILSSSIFIIGTTSGQLGIYNLDQDSTNWSLKSHYGDIINIQIFPSNLVILTIGIDMTCRIWQLTNDQIEGNIRTIIGHTAAINGGVQLIGKGRNFITGGDDGMVNLYECGGGEVIHQFKGGDGVGCIVIDEDIGEDNVKELSNQFECENKVMYVGYKLGIIQKYKLGQHTRLDRWNCHVGVSSMIILKLQQILISGHDDGKFKIWDISQSTRLLNEFVLNSNYKIEYLTQLNSKLNWQLICYNGPDTMIKIIIDTKTFELKSWELLVGMPPLMKVSDVKVLDNQVAIVADGQVYIYK